MGGDEFLVWCEDVDEGALEDRIASALRAMEVERVEDGRTFLFSASAGYVLVPQEASRSTTCIRKRIRRCSRSRWAASAPARDTGLG